MAYSMLPISRFFSQSAAYLPSNNADIGLARSNQQGYTPSSPSFLRQRYTRPVASSPLDLSLSLVVGSLS
ncbi:hypothetical protein WG66_005272 [Moniliophthora roreri]|nr:hypothetical protein WG66_005272 [Moniliophthora roreri]